MGPLGERDEKEEAARKVEKEDGLWERRKERVV